MAGTLRFQRALCIAAHPDDEVLGAGGTLARLSDGGCETNVLVLGEGVGARFPQGERPDELIAQLSAELRQSAAILGATPHQLAFPDNRFDSLDLLDVVTEVERYKGDIDPDLVLTHHPGDLNVDHRVTASAVLAAFRPLPGERRPRTVLAFETLSSSEWNVESADPAFVPNWFEDIAGGLERKIEAMSAYASELREWPHPRSLEGVRIAARRAGMAAGIEAAEAFELLRHVG